MKKSSSTTETKKISSKKQDVQTQSSSVRAKYISHPFGHEPQQENLSPQLQTPRSNRAILKFWMIGLLIIFIGYIFFQSLELVYLIVASYVISAAMEIVVAMFMRLKLPK